MRHIGLHIRLKDTISDVARYAAALNIPIFQCFFIKQPLNTFIDCSAQEVDSFLAQWRPKFDQLYLHGSYWINLSTKGFNKKIIIRELELAKKLAFTHIIIHPGAAKKGKNRQEGIMILAKNLNEILKKEHDVKVILENTAHAGLSIGSDLHDFHFLRHHLEYPEKVLFCVDTVHAFVYKYNLLCAQSLQEFITLLDITMGLANIALIHLNDTKQTCGSRIDRHENIGEGILTPALKSFMAHDAFKNTPIIMELPILDLLQEQNTLDKIRSWDTQK